jgi:hypothetical protein
MADLAHKGAFVVARLTDWMERAVVWAQVTIVIGVGATMAAIVPLLIEAGRDWYDETHPVVSGLKADMVWREGEVVGLRMFGDKVRDCRFLRISARSDHKEGSLDAEINRTDSASRGATRPLGRQWFGVWEIRPVLRDAVAVSVFLEHDCNGRIVRSSLQGIKVP